MSYIAKQNYIEYEEWFDENLDQLDLEYYKEEKVFSNTIHEKFYDLSKRKLLIGSSNKLIELI